MERTILVSDLGSRVITARVARIEASTTEEHERWRGMDYSILNGELGRRITCAYFGERDRRFRRNVTVGFGLS